MYIYIYIYNTAVLINMRRFLINIVKFCIIKQNMQKLCKTKRWKVKFRPAFA